jgi:hypothetical protein
MFLAKKAPAPAPAPEAVEIAFEASEATVPIRATAPAFVGIPTHEEAPPSASAPRGKSAIAPAYPADSAKSPAEAVAPSARNGEVHAPGAALEGIADRLATFQPAHPNLTGPMKFSAPAEPRDLLAPPSAKGGIATGELPKVIQGGAGVTATVAEDGSIHFHDPKDVTLDHSPFQAVGSGVGVGVSGHFDLTDQVMKIAGQDSYAPAKRKLADETREQRLCMAKQYQGERQKHELFTLSTKVRHIAARTDLSPSQRREIVFAIWDECTEESESTTDYGAMARATILSVVREAFPEGSDIGYRPAELLALNQRRSSRQPFAPYNASSTKRGHHPDAGSATECP